MTIPTIERFGDKACKVTVGDRTWYFSYDDCVAYESNHVAIRQAPRSATSEKHMDFMECLSFRKVSKSTFEQIIGES